MNIISIKDKTFKQYKDTKYYCDENGNIYSDYSHKILTPLKRYRGDKIYYYVDINFHDGQGQRHIQIHRIVYETWIGPLEEWEQVNYKDDNSCNNNFNNLYKGTQKENIKDYFNNEHRVGNLWILTVYDKKINQTITFCPASEFIEYSNHSCKNGCISRMFTRNWFKDRYLIIDYHRCGSLIEKEGVTTMADECKPVGENLSLIEARSTEK